MSRAPATTRQQYSYEVAPNRAYYYEDGEGYVGDYSESDGVSEHDVTNVRMMGCKPDVTELYRRKNLLPTRDIYQQQGVFVPSDYYYQQQQQQQQQCRQQVPVVQPQQVRATPQLPMFRKRIVMQPTQRYYTKEQAAYLQQQALYRQSLQNIGTLPQMPPSQPQPQVASATMLRQPVVEQQPPIPQSPTIQAVRRHPVTVRTPRYIRRTPASLYKRPSALCLPIACQPDPAMRRPRRVSGENIHRQECYANEPHKPIKKSCANMPIPPPPVSLKKTENDLKETLESAMDHTFDAALDRLESVFGKGMAIGDTNLIKSMKPKIPPCIKEQQQKHLHQQHLQHQQHLLQQQIHENQQQQQKQTMIFQDQPAIPNISKSEIPELMKTAETYEVEEITSEVLDELLSELTENGLNDVINDEERRRMEDSHKKKSTGAFKRPSPRPPKDIKVETPVKDVPKSYNYEEIKECLSKSHNGFGSESEDYKSQKTLHPKASRTVRGPTSTSKIIPRMLVEDAVELHRTKSYVVNLIDTALSNHFGTTVCEKTTLCKECLGPKNAVEMLKKASDNNMDRDLCVEIAQVLTDSYVSNSTAPSARTNKEGGSDCSCKSQLEEPTFVKQLKQMRWGHLKHIQREVRRLEDLERFLDSCSASTFEKYIQ